MLPNNGILLNGGLRLNYLIFILILALDLLLLNTAHFDDSTVLPFFVFNTFESIFSVFFCTSSNTSTCVILTCA